MRYYTEVANRELRERFEAAVLDWPKVTMRIMFGCPSYQVAGRLFAFLVDAGVVITHLRKADREALSQHCQIEEFQAGERTIARWGQVTVENERDLRYVLPYVRKSYEEALGRASSLWLLEDGP
jgi:hypothetical protein